MQDDESQALQWKKKYFSALEKLEQVEQKSADDDALLRRSLSRLSLALDGFDGPLDKQLDKLRNDIRSGRKPLHIGQLSEEISERGQAVSQQQQSQPKNQLLLLTLLDKLTLPSALNKQKTTLCRELNHKHAGQQINAHIDTLAILLRAAQSANKTNDVAATETPQQAVETPKAKKESSEAGFLSRLFSGDEKKKTEDTNTQTTTRTQPLQQLLSEVSLPSPYSEQLDDLNAKLDNSVDEADLTHFVSKLAKLLSAPPEERKSASSEEAETTPPQGETAREVLLQLLDRITLVDPYAQQLEALREEISGKEESQLDFSQILESLATLISHAQSLSQSEKQALEGFLLNITDTLDQIDSNIRGTQIHQLRQSGEQLDSAVKSQVSDIQTSVLEMNNLAELKQCIQSRLQTINQHLDTFREENEEHYQQMEQAVESLADQVIKIESESDSLRKSLEEQRNKATKDPLTGISNRLAYDEFMPNEYSRWQRFQHHLTLIIWDIDHFKRVNDNFGHQAGDKALTIVAKLLKSKLRKVDHLARFGGEEFVSLLPETEIESALMVANKLRNVIAETDFHFSDQTVPLTISCGLAQFHEGDTPETVFQRADAALYQAKAAGRNQCQTEAEIETPTLGGHDNSPATK
ncbi:diguanylate cyclase (GGDEF domain) [hydrothermal vent metagenome]|uniref:Diguanylate cyclase (GGDEF domain) n=1 Tax=hydrothermal vent metagenome TaxID=652676 RepID=A0A3B0ZQF5_9ZZZZ